MSSPVESILDAEPPFEPARLGLANPGRVFANLSPAALLEHAVRRREGVLTDTGALSAFTGSRTGRSPKDKFTVKDATVADQIDWTANQPMDPKAFDKLRDRVRTYLAGLVECLRVHRLVRSRSEEHTSELQSLRHLVC